VVAALATSAKLLYPKPGDGRPFRGILSWYVTSHSGQLSLLPSVGREVCTSEGTMTVFCSWEGNRRSGAALVMYHILCDIYTPVDSIG